uniref:Phage T4 tail fiber n=1 Tax=Serratia marcescens TaxID=615 RepID=A0A1C3HHN2_SERMA|nr:Phage T4 tail fiber [Serratia marcescens]
MSNLTEKDQWEDGIYQLETSDPVLGGPDGVSNKPAKQLANRTLWLKKQQEKANEALKAHERSRNHPDGTTSAKGFVQLSDNPSLDSSALAATPKAVKAVNDAAAKKAANLADLTDKPRARDNLGLKSAALRDVGTTKGQVMEVGAGGLLMGARHRDDVYTNDGQIFRADAKSANKPPMNATAGIISLPADGGPSTGYVAISPANGAAWIGSSNKPENGVRWSRIYTEDNKPTAGDVNAYSKTESDNRFLQKSGGTVTGKTQFNAGIDFANPNTGITNGTDGASYNGANLLLKSWYGIGFYKTIGEKGITGFIDVRTGDLRMQRNITADGQLIEAGKRVYSPNNKPKAGDVDAVSASEGGEFKKEIRASGGVKIQVPGRNDNGGGVYPGNGDGASYATCNVDIKSWQGIGFYNTCDTVGIKGRSLFIDVRQGNLEAQGIIKGKTVYDASGRVYSPGNKPSPGDINVYSKSESDSRYFARGTTATTKDVAWNAASGVYNTQADGMTMVVHFAAGGTGSTRAADFRFNFGNGGLAFRSSRDDKGYENGWTKVYTDRQRPTAAEVQAADVKNNFAAKMGANRTLSGDAKPTAPGPWSVENSKWTPEGWGSLLYTTNRADLKADTGNGQFHHYLFLSHSRKLYVATNVNGNWSGWQQQFDTRGGTVTGDLTAPYHATPSGVASEGGGAFAAQLNTKAPFYQANFDWDVNEGGRYVPLVKGRSTRKGQGYPTAVSFGYLLDGQGSFAKPCIHVRGDNNADALWLFDPNSKQFTAPGNINVGGAVYQTDGNINGTAWGGYLSNWLNSQLKSRDDNINNRVDWGAFNREVGARATTDYVNGTFVRDIRLGGVESIQAWNGPGYGDQGPYVLTGAANGNGDEYIDTLYRRPMQKNVNNVWYNVWFV